MEKIFVYGTLRKGMYDYDQYLRDEQSFRDYAYIKGSLMTITGVDTPAYLDEGQDMILGEIHEVSDEALQAIDLLKGYINEGNPKNKFDKKVCPVYDEKRNIIDYALVYIYNMENPLNIDLLGDDIEGHDYVKYIQESEYKKRMFDFSMCEE